HRLLPNGPGDGRFKWRSGRVAGGRRGLDYLYEQFDCGKFSGALRPAGTVEEIPSDQDGFDRPGDEQVTRASWIQADRRGKPAQHRGPGRGIGASGEVKKRPDTRPVSLNSIRFR